MNYNEVKKGLFGSKLLSRDYKGEIQGEFKMPKNSPLKLKFLDGGFVFTKNKETLTPTLKTIDVYEGYTICNTTNSTKVRVNLETGATTPEYISERGDYNKHYNIIISPKGEVFRVNEDLSCEKLEYTAVLNERNELKDYVSYDRVLYRNANGKYVILNDKDFTLNIPMEFDNPNVRPTFSKSPLEAYSNGNEQKVFDKQGNLVLTLKDTDKIYEVYSNSSKYVHLGLYNEKTNTTTVYTYDEKQGKIIETAQIKNYVVSVLGRSEELYYETKNSSNKRGLVDSKNKEIIPHKYDNIEQESLKTVTKGIENTENIFIVSNNKDNPNYGNYKGVVDNKGKELLAPTYEDLDIKNSAKYNGEYRFLANDGTHKWGIITDEGKVLSEFNHVKLNVFTYERDTRTSRMEFLGDKEKEYINLSAENAVATPLEVAQVKLYEADLAASCARDREREARAKTKTVEVAKYSEEEIAAASILGTIALDSPVAGLFIAGAMSEATETKTVPANDDSYSDPTDY